MGYIKEPKGVDFLVAPTILTADDTRAIKAAIADYKQAGTTLARQELSSKHPLRDKAKTFSNRPKKLA